MRRQSPPSLPPLLSPCLLILLILFFLGGVLLGHRLSCVRVLLRALSLLHLFPFPFFANKSSEKNNENSAGGNMHKRKWEIKEQEDDIEAHVNMIIIITTIRVLKIRASRGLRSMWLSEDSSGFACPRT